MAQTPRDTEIKETNKSGFDPAGAESLLDVNECGKNVLMAAEAQGVKAMERNKSIDQVLENFESAGGERNGTIGVNRSGFTIALDDQNQAGFPSRRNNSETQDEAEERAEDDATVGKRP